MTPEQQMEEISRAYLYAVAARCGYTIGTWSQDAQGIDVTLGAPGVIGSGTLADPQVNIQLKSTSSPNRIGDDTVSWQFDRTPYERLVARSHCPKLLVILELPLDQENWIEHGPEQLIVRRCAYWKRMTGEPPVPEGQQSIVVHVPKAQRFSPDALVSIMTRISAGEPP